MKEFPETSSPSHPAPHPGVDAPSGCLSAGGVTLDLERRIAFIGEERAALTPTEFDLLRELMRCRGEVVSHEQLARAVRGMDGRRDHAIHVHVCRLRRKLQPTALSPRSIVTVPGIGYVFDPPSPDEPGIFSDS